MFRIRNKLYNAAPQGGAAPASPPPASATPTPAATPATPPVATQPPTVAPGAPQPAAPAAPGTDPGILGGDPAAPAAAAAKDPAATLGTAPEKYQAFKLPDGITMDQAHLGKFETVFRQLGLTQDQAQVLVDAQAGFVKESEGRLEAAVAQQTQDWSKAIKADAEMGGGNYDATVTAAKVGMGRFGSPALKQFLTTTGLANHPELVRAFAKIGKAISEDGFNKPPAGGGSGVKSIEERMYPSDKSKS